MDTNHMYAQLSKGNFTTPAEGRGNKTNALFGSKINTTKQILQISEKNQNVLSYDGFSSDSSDSESDISHSDLLELEELEDEPLIFSKEQQVVCNIPLQINKRDLDEALSPRTESVWQRKPIDRCVFTNKVKLINDAQVCSATPLRFIAKDLTDSLSPQIENVYERKPINRSVFNQKVKLITGKLPPLKIKVRDMSEALSPRMENVSDRKAIDRSVFYSMKPCIVKEFNSKMSLQKSGKGSDNSLKFIIAESTNAMVQKQENKPMSFAAKQAQFDNSEHVDEDEVIDLY